MANAAVLRKALQIRVNNNIIRKSVSLTPQCQLDLARSVRMEYSWPGYGSRYGFTNWPMKKDFHKREIVKEQYPQRMRLNAIRKNSILPAEIQQIADQEIAELPRNSNPIRLVDRCVMTSRPRGTKRQYRVSRIMYRHFADYNQLSGVTRAKW